MPDGRSFRGAIAHGVQSLGTSAAWSIVGLVFSQGSTLLSNIWIANLLGKSGFGEYVIVLATVQAAAALASLGLGYTTTRYIAEWRHRDLVRTGELLGMFSRLSWVAAVVAASLLALSSAGLASGALRAPALGPALLLAAASTLFTVRSGFLTGALNGLESFRLISLNGIVAGIAYLSLTVGGAWRYGVQGAAVGLFVSACLQCTLLTVALHRERIRHALGKGAASFAKERRLLMRFALPAALSGFSTIPVLWAVQALLARSPNGFADLAVYGAGLNLLTMVMFAPSVLNGVAMAWINRSRVVSGEAAYRAAMRSNLGLSFLTVTAALIGMAVVGPTLLGLYGREFRTESFAIILLLASALPETITNALHQSLQARERMWDALLAVNVPRDTVIVIVALLLIPSRGVTGAAIAYFCGRVAALLGVYWLVHDKVGHPAPPVTMSSASTAE
ncbi:MAG: oligosaccharide flippase family protein [Phycisphaerae bacterium]|nr:oligosaccharide flippase family protein [Gemmatimonadaceae bacterium]